MLATLLIGVRSRSTSKGSRIPGICGMTV